MEAERDTIIVREPGFKQGFTMIPNVILKTPHLTHGAKLCYAVLLSYAWTEDRCFPGQERLACDLAVERLSISRYLKELKSTNCVTVIRRGLGKTNVYIINALADVSFLKHQDVSPRDHPDVSPITH